MSIRFGSEEHLECLHPLTTPGPGGASTCLGYKYTYHWLGAPAYVSDDGYVIVVGSDHYRSLDAQAIHDGQAAGVLPDPLPSYSLSTATYAWGYSLWPFLVVSMAIGAWASRRHKHKVAARLAADAETPIASSLPALVTHGDHYIQGQLAPQLRAGEAITHQAYGTSRSVAGVTGIGAFRAVAAQKGILGALTGQRLFLITTRVGAFGPLLENGGVEAIDRARIVAVTRPEVSTLIVLLDDRTTRTIVVAEDRRHKHFSNQDAFLRDLPRLFPAATPSAA